MLKQIAFVTYSKQPDFAVDDQPLAQSLVSLGHSVIPLAWDDELAAWHSFDKIILRSCWNYHLHPNKFLTWLSFIESLTTIIHNPVRVVRWNLHKKYLLELSQLGVILPPTVWVQQKSSTTLSSIIIENDWRRAVVKPAISATAHNTFLTNPSEAIQQEAFFNEQVQQGDVLVQQFMPEVQEEGEWSLIFFDKKFSHAVLKRAHANDFRVQDNFGGTYAVLDPPQLALDQAHQILTLIPELLLYARVDELFPRINFF
jgi:glutathione synthase/RimK-type ligase-like ATP-grasp enzyme